ncbi:flavin reductase family protein [Antarcticibacterium flavum]|uniref:Flavin reductase family protein n=1 Tax=Antarcticibacterium flavum TaxID=2058175 RepID=A0A5B7X3M5_9FLAO|nr:MULTISPECIES: flavin reductase family protein [Antarcticibacterium]MCM4159519.1 flavin reductase [Antarcticibacterium sp. W02-3]QCY69850.1 flavin reductase family protein [Antarcticibacterium flavum]
MLSIDPKEISTGKTHQYLLGAVGPRPIAFASTLDEQGRPNLSPFSFFNVFSANPPILVFSPARRGRDNTVKHTYLNAKATREVVINIVNFDMVQQMSLSSTEYDAGVNEFEKAGFTMLKSDKVKPFRVAESPAQFECKINEVIELGEEGGAGNLVICEVVKMHFLESILDETGGIDQHKIDQVARMGGNWYSRANMGMFEVPKPLSTLGIGVDSIPREIRESTILTGNDYGKLGNVEALPTEEEISVFLKEEENAASLLQTGDTEKLHLAAQKYLENNEPAKAWKLLLAKQF